MVSVQPIQLWRHLGFKKNRLNKNLKSLFYLSYEDALWDILKNKVEKGSKILIPDFFCGDVEINIKNHGYKVIHYKMRDDLRVDLADFKKQQRKENPKVVIVFHPAGIKSNIKVDMVNSDAILIEDCVHQILDIEDVSIKRKNHFIIDSLRKVIPLQGCNLIGRKKDLDFSEPSITQSILYSFKVHLLWFVMVIMWELGFYKEAERYMKIGYDLIGDEYKPARGLNLFKFVFDHVDVRYIKAIKREQVGIYNKFLKSNISFGENDWGNMRGFPIVVNQEIIIFLRSNNLLVRQELTDSRWSKNRKLIYLPLGPHIARDRIVKICNLIKLTGY